MTGTNSYIITIDDDTSSLKNYVESYVPNTQIYKGVVGKNIDLNQLPELTYYTKYCLKRGVPLTDYAQIRSYGALGCFLSHKNLWKTLVNSSDNSMLVMETDVKFLSNFKTDYPKIKEFIESIDEPMFVMLGYSWMGDPQYKNYDSMFNEITNIFWGTQSYLINKKGAQILLDNSNCIDIQVDTFMSITPGIKKLSPKNLLTKQHFHFSTILNPSLKLLVPASNKLVIILTLCLIGVIILLSNISCNNRFKKYKCKIK